MTYWMINAVFLGAAAAVAVVAVVRRPRAARRALMPVLLGLVVLLVLTAVFDNVMIAAGLFHYSEEVTSGILIGAAPLQDFAYPVGAALMLPALWSFGDRSERRERRAVVS